MRKVRCTLLLLIATAILPPSCNFQDVRQNCKESKAQYDLTLKTNTIAAYQQFLENFGTCEYNTKARKILDSIFSCIEVKSSGLKGGERYEFGDMYKNNISIEATKSDGTKETFQADNVAQEDGLIIQNNENRLNAGETAINVCKRLVFKIPASLLVENTQWLLRKKEITVRKIENGYVFPTDDSEVPAQSGIENGNFFFHYWTFAIGVSWKFTTKEKFKTKQYTYSVTAVPAWIYFSKYGVELKNIKRIMNE